jgi:two-component system sensor histidine kinase UhpB
MVKFDSEVLQEWRMAENIPLIEAASSSSAVHDALLKSRDQPARSVERNRVDQAANTPFPVSQRLLLLMEHGLDFVELLGAEGVIEGVSAAIKQLGGYDPKDLIGSKYQDLIHPDDRVRAANAFSRVLHGDTAETVTVRYHRKDGAWRTVQASTRNFLKDPTVRAVVVLTRDVTDQFNAEASLIESNAALGRLSKQLIVAKKEERSYLAAELHDNVQNILVGLRMHMEPSRRTPAAYLPTDLVNSWIELVQEAIDHLHELTIALRAPIIDERGLSAALRRYIDRLSLARGQDIAFEADADVGAMAPDVALACLRITQEALANAVKHSGAKHLHVCLRRVDHDVMVVVRDDGVGFDVQLARARAMDAGSVGLLTMRERAGLAGGVLKIESSPGHGTSVCASFSAAPGSRVR